MIENYSFFVVLFCTILNAAVQLSNEILFLEGMMGVAEEVKLTRCSTEN